MAPENAWHLFGKLDLPFPSHLDERGLAKARELQQKLEVFEQLKGTPKSINMLEEFKSFAQIESRTYNPPRSASTLVRFSGDLTASLLLNLHYPSFTTSTANMHNREIFDPSNPCLKLVINKGFGQTNAFWVNSLCRRERRKVAGWPIIFDEIYSKNTLDAHKLWLKIQYKYSSAKVVVVFGKANRLEMTTNQAGRYEDVKLWGEITVLLRVLYTTERKYVIEQLLIFVHHPEHFYHNWTIEAGELMDAQLNTAAAMASIDISSSFFNSSFFKDRASLIVNRKRMTNLQTTVTFQSPVTIKPSSKLQASMTSWLTKSQPLAPKCFTIHSEEVDMLKDPMFLDIVEDMKLLEETDNAIFNFDNISNYQEYF